MYRYKYLKYKAKYLALKALQTGGNKKLLIGISGISGAGKTTVAKEIAAKINGIYIDEDWFYKRDKPLVKLSNGKTKANWDSKDAIDLRRMNMFLRDKLKLNKPVVLAGFALWESFFDPDTQLDVHFHLKIPKEVSKATRLSVKQFRDPQSEELMFDEVVYPFYLKTLERSKIDHEINVMDGENRRPINEEIDEILRLLPPYSHISH